MAAAISVPGCLADANPQRPLYLPCPPAEPCEIASPLDYASGPGTPPAIDVNYTVENPAGPWREMNESSIREAYRLTRGNLTRAAELFGCHKTTLYRTMKRLGIKREDLENSMAQEPESSPGG